MAKYPNLQPLGQLTIVTVGTTVSLALNCGALGGGTVGTQSSPPLPGSSFRGIVLQAASQTNVGNVYLLPRGSTFAANPGNVIAIIPPNQTVSFPFGVLLENGLLPENFCLDTDTGGNIVYGYGIF
jgi:hypothetical protein